MTKIAVQREKDVLVQRARSEADAMGQLYELYYERIFRFCVHRLFNREAAEDITSTIFLDVARKIHTFAGRGEADFRNWLYAIAINHANGYIRKTLRRKELLMDAAMIITGNGAYKEGAGPDFLEVYKAVLNLEPKEQTIITLRFFEKSSFEEIAEILNSKPVTVRVTLHRALKKLRDRFQNTLNEGE